MMALQSPLALCHAIISILFNPLTFLAWCNNLSQQEMHQINNCSYYISMALLSLLQVEWDEKN